MKLTIDLVPSSSFFKNLRDVLSGKEWDIVRRQVYRQYNNQCSICSAAGRLAAHECWDYDESTGVQKLIGLVALCDLCHHVKHIGFAQILASRGKLNIQTVYDHFCKVNGCSMSDFAIHEREAFETWNRRSDMDWTLDTSLVSDYLSQDENTVC